MLCGEIEVYKVPLWYATFLLKDNDWNKNELFHSFALI